jgi:hypothetical protein
MGLGLRDETFVAKSGYAVRSGTGLAAAQVTGLIAHLLAYNPDLTLNQLLAVLNARKPTGDDEAPPPTLNAFDAMLKSKTSAWRDLANLDGAGAVDREDFAVPHRPLRCGGAARECGSLSAGRIERRWADLGHRTSPHLEPEAREYQLVTDLEVMMAVWEDSDFLLAQTTSPRSWTGSLEGGRGGRPERPAARRTVRSNGMGPNGKTPVSAPVFGPLTNSSLRYHGAFLHPFELPVREAVHRIVIDVIHVVHPRQVDRLLVGGFQRRSNGLRTSCWPLHTSACRT